MRKKPVFKILFPPLLALFVLVSCAPQNNYLREDVADRVAHPVWMLERPIQAAPFALMAYERMHERHAPAHIYIEGEGKALNAQGKVTRDPTPLNPVALHLASKDLADNVAYIARPCQYTGMLDPAEACDPAVWTDKQFAPEVLIAYNQALDDIKARYDITGFHLVGFSGGGAIAAYLATQRSDVLSLRTVAGWLDEVEHLAPALVDMPQHHFIGGQDQRIRPAVLHGYLQALGETNCVAYTFIQEAEHEKGWVDKWPAMLKKEPACGGPPAMASDLMEQNPGLELEPMMAKPDFDAGPEPVRVTREKPSKP